MNLDLASVHPIPDIAASLESQPTSDLMTRVASTVQRIADSSPGDHVSFGLSRIRGEYIARIVSGPERGRIDVELRGVGSSMREALLKLLGEWDDEEDDERLELANEWAEGQVGHG